MLIIALCVIAVLSPIIAWRWPSGLLLNSWRWPLLIWATLVLQFVALQIAMPHGLAATLHVATYAFALVFLWLNRKFPGVILVGIGALSNGLVIALNGGTLPASPEAVERAGRDTTTEFANSGILEDPVLPWLGDFFAWPAPLPLANTFSIGDVLIIIGVFVAAWSGSRRIPWPRGATPAEKPTSVDDITN